MNAVPDEKTPLQNFLNGWRQLPGRNIDSSNLAVGSDNPGASPLLAGVQALIEISADRSLAPNCLSWHLVGKWTGPANQAWLDDTLASASGYTAPIFCFVFHKNINVALRKARNNNVVNVDYFEYCYKGSKGWSYKEVMTILSNGYVHISDYVEQVPGCVRLAKS